MKEWIKAALVRAVKTGAQTAVALIGTTMVSIVQLDWVQIAGVCATAMVLSLLTSVAGIPEADDGKSVFSISSPKDDDGKKRTIG